MERLLFKSNRVEAADELADLADSLADMLHGYEAALAAHDLERPYNMTFRRP